MAEKSAPARRLANWQREFLQRRQLPVSYLDEAVRWFDPLARHLLAAAATHPGPLLVGLNGCQGSGKSTLCDYLATQLKARHGCNTVVLSLDDFYLARAERRRLAATVHPLLVTRGVPGTHDMPLLRRTLAALQSAGQNGGQLRGRVENRSGAAGESARVGDSKSESESESRSINIPRFDKGADDRLPAGRWDAVTGPVDIILLEGWCLGARPVKFLEPALNALEAIEDADGAWRRHVNAALAADFMPLYPQIDLWIMLRAPDFDCVYRWRLEQEQKLARASAGDAIMSEAQLARFIQHYERLTRHCLESLPSNVDILYQLDATRAVRSVVGALRGP